MYLSSACSFWLFLGSAMLELPSMMATGALALVYERPLAFLAAAAMGFLVNWLAYVVIKTASSLTLKVGHKPCSPMQQPAHRAQQHPCVRLAAAVLRSARRRGSEAAACHQHAQATGPALVVFGPCLCGLRPQPCRGTQQLFLCRRCWGL